jgi:ATP-dependent DNA helicase RecQ
MVAAPAVRAEAHAVTEEAVPGEDWLAETWETTAASGGETIPDALGSGDAATNGASSQRPGRGNRRRRRRRGPSRHGGGPRPGPKAALAAVEEDDEPASMPSDEPSGPLTPIAQAARRIGIRRLHPEQERAIEATLAGRNVLMVLPTGFGKSACYQIPSMLLPKPVVLISPLLALLKDQHQKLIKYDVPCVRLDGTVRGKARAAALERIRAGGSLLVMTTPETLGSEEASSALRASGLSLAAIDEAHCISEWGYDFRPAYLQIGDRLRALGAPPIMALTATATEKVRADIVRFLGMRDAEVVSSSPHRSNLAFEVIECREAARARALARLAQRLRRPGIIYCTTTREVDTVYTILMRLGIPAHRYHGKMAAGERNTQQDLFMKPGRRTVMIATNAFGLGIDKPDIRYVVHGQSPASLEQYVQEAGRAGRDGAKANCLLLFDPDDRQTHEALLARSRLRPDQLFRLGSALAAWAAEGRTPTIDALALSAELGERATNALLVPIEEAEIVRTRDDNTVEALVPATEIEERVRSLAGQFATMRTQDSRRLDSVAEYAHTPDCRAVFLQTYFGEDHEGACHLCDICRGRPQRPSTFWQPVAAPPRPGRKRKRGRHGAPQPSPRTQRGRGRGNGAPATGQQQQAQGGGKPAGGRSQRRRRGRRRRGRPDQAPPASPPPASSS